MTMKTVICEQPGHLALAERAMPNPGPDDVLIRIRRVGICGTDIHAFRGRQPFFSYPRVICHELGVEVVEVGPNERAIVAGDRCSVEPYMNCGHCIACADIVLVPSGCRGCR